MLRIFPKYRTVTISVSEVFIGLGYMIGPPLGGVLFENFGFTLMFYGTGTLSFIFVYFLHHYEVPTQWKIDSIWFRFTPYFQFIYI